MPEVEIERTDRRRARTRAALVGAGRALFAIRAFEGVSIDDIVAAAEVSKGSFYNHFPGKEALAKAIAEAVRADVESLSAQITGDAVDPAERVARALCGFVRQARQDPVAVRGVLRLFQGAAVPDADMNRGVRADIDAGLNNGRFSGLTRQAAVLMSVGVAQIAVTRVLQTEGPHGDAGLARDLTFGLLRGLGLPSDEARQIAARAADAFFSRAGQTRSAPLP